jgi:hypothetical protein
MSDPSWAGEVALFQDTADPGVRPSARRTRT